MLGIAESQEGYSRILARNLVIGFEYKLDQLAELLEIQVESMKRKGVVCRGDAQLLFIHLKKDKYSTPQYEDHLEGGILFWSGQNRIKVVEKNLLDLKKDVFVFIQPERKTPFEYYGRALPLRIQINWEPDIPSRIAFDLVEYNAQKSKTTGMFLNNHSNLILHDSEAPHSTVKDAFVTVRAAQTLYRQRALQLWGNMCAVTSVDNPGWLIASHIKPWRESSDVERVDPANSLMLTPNYDKLFDRGVISFSPDNGKIILPNTQTRELWNNLNRMHIDEDVKLRYLPDGIRTYLEYHNNYVFNFTPKDNRTNDEFVEDLLAKAMA